MPDQTPLRKEFHGFTWDLLLPSNIDTEIYAGRVWEPILTKYIEHHVVPGMNVVDVGANFGWFTLIMAKRVTKTGRVHAFEPEPGFFRRLINHLALNFSLKNISDNNVTLYDMALSDKLCTRWIVKNPGPYYSSATISETMPDINDINVESTLIHCIQLDAIWEPEQPLHFIKVDVDGYELKVLKGAEKTITTLRPRMILEISKPEDAEEMYQLLKSWNYNVKLESSMCDASLFDVRAELKRTTGSINIFAEPANIGDIDGI